MPPVEDKEMSRTGLKKEWQKQGLGRKEGQKWMGDGWNQTYFVTCYSLCHSKIRRITDSKILNFVPLFSACLPTMDQYRLCGWKQMYFCYACHSETIPTVEEDILSVWVLFGGKWLADWGASGHRIQQWWSVTHKPLNQSHMWYPG